MYLVDPDPTSPMATLACEFQILNDRNHPQAYSVFRERSNFGNREEGTILLQDEGSEVWFKNIKIKEL